MGLTGQVMACAAIPMTIVMFLQLILMIIGVGFGGDSDGDGADVDAGADSDFDVDSDFDADFDADIDADAGFDPGFGIDADAGGDSGFEVGGEAAAHELAAHSLASGHSDSHHHGSAKLLTVRGVVAFFALGGWAGLAALTAGIKPLWATMIALLAGVAAMFVASVVIRFALRMQSSGNISLGNAVGQTADVYITIPPSRFNTGKVTMVLQERFVEIDAVTDDPEPIKPKTKVEVVGTAGKDCVVVTGGR